MLTGPVQQIRKNLTKQLIQAIQLKKKKGDCTGPGRLQIAVNYLKKSNISIDYDCTMPGRRYTSKTLYTRPILVK